MSTCLACQMGMHSLCVENCYTSKDSESSHSEQKVITDDESGFDGGSQTPGSGLTIEGFFNPGDRDEEDRSGRTSRRDVSGRSGRAGTGKRESQLKDQQSTGRKRAARLYPLIRTESCEWRGLANCGGGTSPIRGCISGKQQARHHGPDKNVANNEEGNVHRICHYCHNRWHAANNKDYDWNSTEVQAHRPEAMTSVEQTAAVLDEMRYLGSKQSKVRIAD